MTRVLHASKEFLKTNVASTLNERTRPRTRRHRAREDRIFLRNIDSGEGQAHNYDSFGIFLAEAEQADWISRKIRRDEKTSAAAGYHFFERGRRICQGIRAIISVHLFLFLLDFIKHASGE